MVIKTGDLFAIKSVTHAPACHSLGYITSTTENVLQIPTEKTLVGLQLATTANGIVGARLILEAGSSTRASPWVGNIGAGEPDVAFGILSLPGGLCPLDFAASFDFFKMISLAINEIGLPDTSYCDSQFSEGMTPHGLVPQPLWTPCCPRETSFIPVPENLECQTFNRILNINFGGTRGENLKKLTRIVVHMESRTAAFVGIMFEFDGQTPILCGKQGRTEVSFLISGPTGERISEVIYEQTLAPLGLRSLRIQTNLGRSATFAPDELRTERSGELTSMISFPLVEERDDSALKYSKGSLRAPEGQIITGFTSVLEARTGAFQTFGLQCSFVSDSTIPGGQVQSTASDPTPSAAELCFSVGSYLIGGARTRCMAYTYASLKSVKRIRFSCGSSARPRQENEISGLWLEYFGPQPPAIIGQWISEIDSMELEPHEEIVEMVFGISKTDFSFNEKFHLGRVVRISLLTSRMQSKLVQNVKTLSEDGYIELKFRTNKMEKLVSSSSLFQSLLLISQFPH
ncbi:hypothetical protein VTN96DRAFT_1744 [Rasamsonia emersonii]